MVAPIKFLSGRQQQQKIGVEGSTESIKVLEVVGRTGIGTTIFEPSKQLDVRGDVIISGELTVGDTTIGEDFSTRNLSVSGISTFGDDVIFTGANSNARWDYSASDLTLFDNTRLIFGSNDDFQIWHGGSHTFMKNSGGDLRIRGDKILLKSENDSEKYLEATVNNDVKLFFNDNEKFATISTGATVTGDLYVSGDLYVADDLVFDEFNSRNANVSGIATIGTLLDVNGDLDVDGHTELDDLNVSGIVTTASLNVTDKLTSTGIGISVLNGASDTATIAGPSNLIIDPGVVGDNTGTVRIKGDFFVDGTQTTVNSTTVEIADKVIGIATTCTSDILTDGAGIGIGSDKTFLYHFNSGTNPSLKSSENLNVPTGKGYQVNQVEVLNATTLGSNVVNSSLTNLGTLTALDVNGHTELDNVNVSGASTFTGNIDANGNLDVDGQTDLDVLNVAELATFTGNIDANGNLDVDGHTELDNLNVSGVSTFTGNIDANGNLDVDGHTELDDVNVSGASTFAGNINANGNIVGDTATNISGINSVTATSFFGDGSGLENTGALLSAASGTQRLVLTSLTSGTMISAATDADLSFNATSNLLSAGKLIIAGISTFNANVSFGNAATIGPSTFSVNTPATMDSLTIEGGLTLNNNVNADFNGNLDVDGHTELDDLNVSGVSTFVSNVAFSNDVDVTKSLTAKQVTADYFGEQHKTFVDIVVTYSSSKTSNHPHHGSGTDKSFVFDGDEAPYIQFIPGKTYRFGQVDGSNTNHRLKFYLESNKTTEYTDGVTTSGTPGTSGAYTQIVVTKQTPSVLYYESENGSDTLIGNEISVVNSFSLLENNVGIGTTNPLQKLQVGVNDNSFVVTSLGAVGINSTSPAADLDVNGHTELDTLNVSGISTLSALGVAGLTTTNTLKVIGVSTFNDDISVSFGDTTSSIGIGTTAFTPIDDHIVDIRGNVNIDGKLIVDGTDVGAEIAAIGASFTNLDSTNINVTGIATFNVDSTVDIKNGIGITGGDVSIGSAGIGFYYDDSAAKVGIGTTAPEYKLDVHGDVHVTGFTTTRYLTVGTGNSEFTFPAHDGIANSILKTDGNGNVDWFTNSAIRQSNEQTAGAGQTDFTVSYTAGLIDVFINGVKLASSDFVGTSGTNIVLNAAASAGDTFQVVSFSNDSVSSRSVIQFWEGDNLGNIYNINDNVGIGVSSPTQLLDVSGDVRIRGGLYDSQGINGSSGSNQQVPVADGSGGWQWSAAPTTGVATAGGNIGNVQFHNNAGLIAGSDDFVFNPTTQKVGMGTAVPRAKLDVIGDIFAEGNVGVGTTIPTSAVLGSNTKVIHAGIVTANNFYGSGASLTSLNASQLSSGIVPAARLSGTYDIDITGTIDGVGQSIGIDTITVNNNLTVGAGNTFLKSDFNGNLEVTGVTTTGTLHIGSNNVGITTILDEDNMVSDSATALVTQQSIKKYVDDQITNQDLDVSDGSVSSSVDLDSQSLTIQGTSNEVDVALSSQTYTVGLPNDVTVAGTLTVNTGIANTMSLSNTLTNVGQTTNQIILHTLDSSEYRSVEYSIQVDQGSNFHLTKLLTIHDGTTAYLTEYGTIFNNSTIATYNVDIAGGNIRLLATAGSATAANYVVNFVANKV